jgi:hypothetical protein
MNETEKHQRTMNINAHFAWSLAMWGSGDAARENGYNLFSPIGYYYAAFHAGFALANTDHTIHLEHLRHVGHTQLGSWVERLMGKQSAQQFNLLRSIRETINYLGVADASVSEDSTSTAPATSTPKSKICVVRGGPLLLRTNGAEVDFPQALLVAQETSKSFVIRALELIEGFCATHNWPSPKRGDDRWLDDYLQEDVLVGVLPQGNARRDILSRGFSLLK